jgi:hypothetical protein
VREVEAVTASARINPNIATWLEGSPSASDLDPHMLNPLEKQERYRVSHRQGIIAVCLFTCFYVLELHGIFLELCSLTANHLTYCTYCAVAPAVI